MTNFVLVYTGGSTPKNEAEQQQMMADWGAWYEKLGDAIVDGGTPFEVVKTVGADGVRDGAATSPEATGYSIILADSLDDAVAKVQNHPHIKHGGEVSVYETHQM